MNPNTEHQICGTCEYHYFEPFDDSRVCANCYSEYCTDWTVYDHSCADWEPRADT